MKVKVRPGDTLWLFSRLFRIPLPLLEDANKHADPDRLLVGEEIHIPGFIPEEHAIQKGDTYWEIARRLNISPGALALLNPEHHPDHLPEGGRIRLPKRVVRPIVTDPGQYDFARLQKDLRRIEEVYPFISVETVGSSVLARPLLEIRTGRGERTIHFNAAFHANEWITVPVLMRMFNEFLLALTNGNPLCGIFVLPLYENNVLSIVPMVNPDGVDLVINGPPEKVREQVVRLNGGSTDFSGWKANIRGVDLNDQFPANWKIEKEKRAQCPGPRDYPGEAPLTEPEASSMGRLTRERDFARVFALHTQGKEFYWGYEGLEPPESEALAKEFARVSGYKSVRYVDSHAGYKDWFVQEFRRPGFTFELGSGVNPLPICQFPEMVEEMIGVFLSALYQ